MKTLFFIIFFIFSFNVFSQVYQVNFGSHIKFNRCKYVTYDELIKDGNILGSEFKSRGSNVCVVNLDEKIVYLDFENNFVGEKSIINHKFENGLLFITLSDIESNSDKIINSYIVINQNDMDRSHPFFTFYYISSTDGLSNGIKTY